MRFSLRSLFFFVTVSAVVIGIAWLATEEYRRQMRVRRDLESIGASWVGFVPADGDYQTSVVFGETISGDLDNVSELWRIEFKGFDVSAADVQSLTSLETVSHLMFVTCDLEAEDVKPLAEMQHVDQLLFWNAQVTDEVIDTVAKIPGLKQVAFKNTAVTERGLEALAARRPDVKAVLHP